MLVWRGKGILALIIAVIINVVINESANAYFGVPEGVKHYRDAHPWLWLVGMSLSAVACWYIGVWIEKQDQENAKYLLDPETGQQVRLLESHDFFWIPVKWWSLIWLTTGLWLSLG